MATAVRNPEKTETKVIVVEPESFTLTLSPREAQVISALLAYTRDSDQKFPEVGSVFRALRSAGVPDYYNKIRAINRETGLRASIALKDVG